MSIRTFVIDNCYEELPEGIRSAKLRLTLDDTTRIIVIQPFQEGPVTDIPSRENLGAPVNADSNPEVRGSGALRTLYIAANTVLCNRAKYGSQEFEDLRDAIHAIERNSENAALWEMIQHPNPILPGSNEP